MPVYANSLCQRVTDLVTARGKASFTEVAQAFPDHTKKQVHDALCNAQYSKRLKVILRGSYRGKRDSVWAAEVSPLDPGATHRKPEKPQPVASVWELGRPTIQEWPLAFEGGRAFNLLGPWTDPDDSASNDSRKAA